jgi:NTP pyrophosphatase (non-canonical NTP hydrolase)
MSAKMNPKYRPRTWAAALGYLVEEAGEVLAAVGKTQRWGALSVNPELPRAQQETNIAWLMRELRDLERAIGIVRYFAEIEASRPHGGPVETLSVPAIPVPVTEAKEGT